jgi:hypothetical protein
VATHRANDRDGALATARQRVQQNDGAILIWGMSTQRRFISPDLDERADAVAGRPSCGLPFGSSACVEDQRSVHSLLASRKPDERPCEWGEGKQGRPPGCVRMGWQFVTVGEAMRALESVFGIYVERHVA